MSGSGRITRVTVAALVASGVFTASAADTSEVSAAPDVAATVCLADLLPERLDTLFDTEPGGVVGADYQRAFALPDGRVLWTFQDAAIRVGGDEIVIVHNIAAVQDGNCFTIRYRGSRTAPRPMFFADRTTPFRRWFWPLDAAMGTDGRVHVYAAEMEERGEAYLTHTVPVGTWVAVFDPSSDKAPESIVLKIFCCEAGRFPSSFRFRRPRVVIRRCKAIRFISTPKGAPISPAKPVLKQLLPGFLHTSSLCPQFGRRK